MAMRLGRATHEEADWLMVFFILGCVCVCVAMHEKMHFQQSKKDPT